MAISHFSIQGTMTTLQNLNFTSAKSPNEEMVR
jgi:hypothetical protein